MIHSLVRRILFIVAQAARGLKHLYLRSSGVKIGRNTMISMGAKIDTHAGAVEIGEYCHITYGCVILAHDGAAKQIYGLKDTSGKVVIEDYVFVGVNSVILNNVRIGKNSVIAAGSVVRNDIPPNSLVAGNPAKIVKRLDSKS